MPLILSLTFAAGVLLIFMSSTERWAGPKTASRPTLAAQILIRKGFTLIGESDLQ